jgi:hypothetical protein
LANCAPITPSATISTPLGFMRLEWFGQHLIVQRHFMKSRALAFLAVLALSLPQITAAQERADWVPQGIASLQQSSSSKTEFTLDHSMLVLASKLQPDDDLRRVIAGVDGISVHRFRFSDSGQYDPAVLKSVSEEYRAAGWKLVKDTQDKNKGDAVASTGVWTRLENNAARGVAFLIAKSNEVDFVSVSGSISPVDLSHLGGHFGIPKIEGGVVVPNSGRRP